MPKIKFKTEIDEIWKEKVRESANEIIKAEAAKAKAEARISKAKQDLSIIIPMLGLEENKVETTSQGTFTFVGPSKSSSFKKDQAKTRLAESGVDIDLINQVWKESTEESDKKAYVKWDKPRKKKGKK